MASVLKEHAVATTDKITLGKVEELLNSVLKELQKEKARSQQLQEQVKKLLADGSKHDQQKLLATLSTRLAHLENTSEDDKKLAEQKKAPPPPPDKSAAEIEELRKAVKQLEAKLSAQQKEQPLEPSPPAQAPQRPPPARPSAPKHREPPSAVLPTSSSNERLKDDARAQAPSPPPAPHRASPPPAPALEAYQLEKRTAALETRQTELHTAFKGTDATVGKLKPQLDELKGSLSACESRLEQSTTERLAAHAKATEEMARKSTTMVASSVAAQAKRINALEASQRESSKSDETAKAMDAMQRKLDALEQSQKEMARASIKERKEREAMYLKEAQATEAKVAERLRTLEERLIAVEATQQEHGQALLNSPPPPPAAAASSPSPELLLAPLEARLEAIEAQQRAAAAERGEARTERAAQGKMIKDLQQRPLPEPQKVVDPAHENAVRAMREQLATLSAQCAAAEAHLDQLSSRMPVTRSGVEEAAIGAAELQAALERKVDRTEWPEMREEVVQALSSSSSSLSAAPAAATPQPMMATAPQPHRRAPVPQAWTAQQSSSEPPPPPTTVETRRLVDSTFDMTGIDGKLYRGMTTGLQIETHVVQPERRTRGARPSSAPMGRQPVSLQRPGSSKMSRPSFGAATSTPVAGSYAFTRRGLGESGVVVGGL